MPIKWLSECKEVSGVFSSLDINSVDVSALVGTLFSIIFDIIVMMIH